jgi:hypothetical protein
MYTVKTSYLEEFCYTWADAIATANDFADLYGEQARVRRVGSDVIEHIARPRYAHILV